MLMRICQALDAIVAAHPMDHRAMDHRAMDHRDGRVIAVLDGYVHATGPEETGAAARLAPTRRLALRSTQSGGGIGFGLAP